MTKEGRQDRAVNWLLYAIAAVTALTLFVGAVGLREIAAGNTTLDAQRKSDRLAACRAAYRAEIDDATVDLLLAQAASDELIRRGFAAAVLGDQELLREIGLAAAPASARVNDAIDEVADATDAYAKALHLSREDPDGFLDHCPDSDRTERPAPVESDLRDPVSTTTQQEEVGMSTTSATSSTPTTTSTSTTTTSPTTTTTTTTTTTPPLLPECPFGLLCLDSMGVIRSTWA